MVRYVKTCVNAEGEAVSGDEFDREEELRGYNRAIDFTLHTILEESGEDSEPEHRTARPPDRKRSAAAFFFSRLCGLLVNTEHIHSVTTYQLPHYCALSCLYTGIYLSSRSYFLIYSLIFIIYSLSLSYLLILSLIFTHSLAHIYLFSCSYLLILSLIFTYYFAHIYSFFSSYLLILSLIFSHLPIHSLLCFL